MIRATSGVWLNYGTTFLFQILFASRYGSGPAATTFVITFAFALAVTGVIANTAQSLVVPRLMTAGGTALARPAVSLLIRLTLAGAAVLVGAVALSGSLARLLASSAHLGRTDLAGVLVYAALFGGAQLIAADLIAVEIARGRRFVPALAPALPSIVACLALAFLPRAGTERLYQALCLGSAFEIAMLLWVTVRGARPTLEPADPIRIGRVASATVLQFALFGLFGPVERIMASTGAASGGANYNYATRSLAVVQQLIIGGALIAALGSWSRLARENDRPRFAAAVTGGLAAGLALLATAAAVGAAAARPLVAVIYEHGAFTPADTRAVAQILLIALPGFAAEGIGLLAAQALVAARRNVSLLVVGFVLIVARIVLVVVLGGRWGATGVAVGYSIASLAAAGAQVVLLRHAGLLVISDGRLRRGLAFAVTISAAAILVSSVQLPTSLRLVALAIVGSAAAFSLGIVELIRPR